MSNDAKYNANAYLNHLRSIEITFGDGVQYSMDDIGDPVLSAKIGVIAGAVKDAADYLEKRLDNSVTG